MPVSSIDPFGLESSDNPPPGSYGLETHLLGVLLNRNDPVPTDLPVSSHHFADPVHGVIFEHLAARAAAGYAGDTLLRDVAAGRAPALELMLMTDGGSAYLDQIVVSAEGLALNLVEGAATIRDGWVRRRLIDLSERLLQDAFDGALVVHATPAVDLAKAAIERLAAIIADAERIGMGGETQP